MMRYGPDPAGIARYATVGMSRQPLPDPTSPVLEPVSGPRAELVLELRGVHDSVLRPLAVLAAAPAVEGTRPSAGSSFDLGQPLCDGATVTAVLVGEPDGVVADLILPAAGDGTPRGPVHFFPLLPMTPAEADFKRARDAATLEERWLIGGVDLRDPYRVGVPLG